MPTDFGTTPLSTTPLGTNQFPVGSCFVPGTAAGKLTSLEGILINTDGNGYASSAMRVGLKDGDDVTLGTTTQTKATDGSATSWSVIQLQKGILDKLLNSVAVTGTFWQATQPVSGTFWQATQPISVASLPALPANQSVNVAQMAGTATDTNSGNKSAGTLRIVLATDQPTMTNAQPVSGTVTANAGTNLNTSALALDTSVNGVIVAQGSTTSGEKGPMVQGAVTTNAPSYTTAQTSPLSLDASGLLRVSLKDTPANTNKLLVTPDSVALPANQSTNVNQIGGTNIVTGGIAGLMAVGGPVASGSANADNPIKVGGAFNTTQPTVTNGQIVDAQMTARGAQIVATGVDTFNTTINAALPAGTNVIGHVIADSGSTTAVTQATASNLNAQVVGAVASAGANAGNPLKIGGAFNTTQPTVTTGQIVDSQYTARGAAIVATGVDTFNVTVNAALPTGANTIGAVTQASGPWTNNVTQFGSNNITTGTGAGGVGIPRVTVSNDTQLQVWDGATGPVAVKAANTPPALADKSYVQSISPNNTGLPVNIPVIVQKTNNKSTGSVASLALAFGSNNILGNSIIVVCAVGNGTAPTISDTAGNTYTQAAQIANGTALNTAVFYAVNVAAGANTVTVNNGGTTASIAMEIYEVSGLLTRVPAQPSITATATGSSGTAATANISAITPNEYAFAAVGVGTAAQTITAGSGWTNDSGQQNPTTPAGLFSFISMSEYLGSIKAVTPQATFTSEPWAIAVATFRPVLLGIEGTMSTAIGGAAAANFTADGITGTSVQEIGIGLPGGGVINRLFSAAANTDASSGTSFPSVGPMMWNGASWDFQRNNLDNITLLASAARTTTQTVADQTNYNARGIIVVLDMTVVGTGSVTLEIDAKDPVSGKYYAVLTGAAVTTNSTNVYTVYPGNTVTANVSASTVLPRTWRVKVTANNANSATYSVGAMLIL